MNRIYKWVFIFIILTQVLVVANAQIPANYYDSAKGKNGVELLKELHKIIRGHAVISYSDLWTAFQTTDKKPISGYVWDMYSDIPGGTPPYDYSYPGDQCGTYSTEGDCYNREHSFPKSWWGGSQDTMYTDLFHIVPTDGKVNGMRASYPYGEVGTASWTSANGCKLGTSNYSGYSGTVFEPIDAYKGDFSRNYFYMATRYLNKIDTWGANSDMLDGSGFSSWAENLLLDWNHQDPVSTKEINRCDDVYGIQHNRNPFIDHPEFVQRIWGGIDDFAPIFYAPYPKSDNIGSTSFDITVSLDEECTVYFVVLVDGASAPSSSQVKAGKDANGNTLASNLKGSINVVLANTNYSSNISNLSVTTAYDVYVVAEDNSSSSNLQQSPSKIDVTTGSSSGGSNTTYSENFDIANNWSSNSGYAANTYTISSPQHNDHFSTNKGLRESTNTNSNPYSFRLSNTAATYLRYECEGTVSGFSIYAARWDNSPTPNVTVRYSVNSGTSYTTAFNFTGNDFTGDKVYKQFSYTFGTPITNNAGSKIYIEFYTSSGERMLYDDFEISFSSNSNSNESNITLNSLWSEPQDINYTLYNASSNLTTSNAIEVAKFSLQDGGDDLTDADAVSTKLTDISFMVDNWENIQALALFEGSTKKAEITSINSSTVTFSSISGGIEAADESAIDFSLYATFKTNVDDNENLQFTISSVSAAASGSSFINTNAGGAYTDNSNNNNAIEVTATELAYVSNKPPTSVNVNSNFNVSVEAVDVNSNRDLDATYSITLSKASGNGVLSSATNLTKSLSLGLAEWTDIQYDTEENFTISASASGITNATSSTIEAMAAASYFSDLIITEYVEGSGNNKYIEIWNNTANAINLNAYELDIYVNGSTSNPTTISLSGSIATGDVYIIANNSATAWSGTPDLSTSSLTFNGNDVVALVNTNAKGAIDQLGVLGSSSNFAKDVTLRRNGDVSGPTTTYNSADWTQYSQDDVSGLNNSGPLPIELLEFSVIKDHRGNIISWATASEHNNAYFIVQKSSNIDYFYDIAEVEGFGNSNEYKHYQYIDNSCNGDCNFYRLKQVDFDGKYTYSNIVSLTENYINYEVTNIYWNQRDIVVSISANKSQSIYFELFDIYGKQIISESRKLVKGRNNIKLNIKNKNKGIYIVKITFEDNSNIYNSKLLIF